MRELSRIWASSAIVLVQDFEKVRVAHPVAIFFAQNLRSRKFQGPPEEEIRERVCKKDCSCLSRWAIPVWRDGLEKVRGSPECKNRKSWGRALWNFVDLPFPAVDSKKRDCE
jgi:hypothetical protein